MASAIHKTEPGNTLAGIAEQYYALRRPDGSIRVVELKKVTNAIRGATATNLTNFQDKDALPDGTTLAIPTLRELNRALLTDNSQLLQELLDRGFDHARKLLHYTDDQILALLRPLSSAYSEEEVRRTWLLTALLNLDGVDCFTAKYLHDKVGIRSLQELASQSPATIDSVLQTLISPPHSRPPELTDQDHAKRWIISAKILVRKRIGEITKIKDRFFQVPFDPSVAQRQAEFYENAAANDSFTSEEASLASKLSKIYRFQAAVLRGNIGIRSGNWTDALAGYQEARRQWHRLAEATGAGTLVNDDQGLNLKSCINAARRLLDALPTEEDSPLDAPRVNLRRGGTRRGYRLRGFRYDELIEARKQELRTSLANVRVHQLPKKTRSGIYRETLYKTRFELRTADANLVTGLIPGAETSLARDLEEQDRKVLRRNLGATSVSTLFSGGEQLQILDAVGDSLPLSDIAPFLPDRWLVGTFTGSIPGERAMDVLSDQAQAQYPRAFLNRADVAPSTKFLVMPGAQGRDRFVPLTASFAEDYEEQLLKPRLMSKQADDLLFEDEVWTSAGAFIAAAPYIYATQIPLGLRQAYGKLNQPTLARQFGGMRTNSYDAEGTLVRDVASMSAASSLAFDPDLFVCSTDFTGSASVFHAWELVNYAETWIRIADYAYRREDREGARSYYADIRCAIEKFFPSFAGEADLALTGVLLTIQSINNRTFAGVPADRKLQKLSTLDVVIVENDVPHRVMEETFLHVRSPIDSSIRNLSSVYRNLPSYFEFHVLVDRDPVTGNTSQSNTDIPEIEPDEDSSGTPAQDNGMQVYVNHDAAVLSTDFAGTAQLYQLYLYCVAKIQAIDAGLNWYGYSDEFVPSWSFDHLYNLARDLCNRALEAEQRVFSLLQMYETAEEKEFLANQSEELTGAEQAVAEAKVEQQTASNLLARAQALQSEQQAEAQAKKSGVAASVAMAVAAVGAAVVGAVGTAVSGGTATAAIVAGTAAAAGPVAGFIGGITGHTQDVKVLEKAEAVTAATSIANQAALNVSIAERDVAALQTEQATEYVAFLLAQQLTSDAYLYLMGLAKSILETYIHHANRMAWLAERALENESRQAYDLIAIDYTTQDELTDLTRAQQITSGLEALRSEYVAGQTARLQEVKWTIALSELDPIAWQDLRETGTCTFVLRQRMIDMYFPGLYQHRLKDVQLEIIGLVPPEGVHGVITNPGVSWIRVPNEQSFLSDQVEDDWTTTSLEGSTAFDEYDQYIMKRLLTNLVTLTLSQFDVRSDRAVLSAPQGMLTPVQHLGLDSGWTLKLHRQSNNFDFKQIVDASITFWFLCAYDSDLEQAQVNALIEDGKKGLLAGVSRTAFAIHQPDAWNAFVSDPRDGEALDLRYLTVDVANLPLWETNRKLTNVLLACARAVSQTKEITLRISCDNDPVGFLVTTDNGAMYSLIGIDTSSEDPPPQRYSEFESWVRETFYLIIPDIELPDLPGPGPVPPGPPDPPDAPPRIVPFRSPEVRWVIKAAAGRVGEGWLKEDEDGHAVRTSSGPLQGWANGSARYNDGGEWTNLAFQVKVAHHNGTVRLRLRDDGVNHYALQLSPADIKVFKVVAGVESQLGNTLSYAYPHDEFLLIDVSIVGDRLSASVDRITLFENIDGAPGAGQLKKGSVALQVVTNGGTEAIRFDDVKVIRLTGKGLAAETLLSEPFTALLPRDWTFADGTSQWEIAPRGTPILDLSQLFNVILSLDYRYQMNVS